MNGRSSRHAEALQGPRMPSPDGSDEDTEHEDLVSGDYSTRMEQIFDEEGQVHSQGQEMDDEEDEDEEGFVYQGVDSEPRGAYRDQLHDILGSTHEDDELDEKELSGAPALENATRNDLAVVIAEDVRSGHTELYSPPRLDMPSTPQLSTPVLNGSVEGTPTSTPSRLARPFIHPTISRLRSYTPRQTPAPSADSVGSYSGRLPEGFSPAPSHFSAISRTSSLVNLHEVFSGKQDAGHVPHAPREVFKWTRLRTIEDNIFPKQSQKAAALLGAPAAGSPTVLAANGLVCVGSESGSVFVFDFKQTLRCMCGVDGSMKTVGPVTALALSHDHTFLASGHAQGHILLYDLRTPAKPTRTVAPTTLAAVASGRREGHLTGSRIVSVGFVAGRHTAIVSADEHGLSFYHSLGKVLFVEASDTLRILGKYPDDDQPEGATSALLRATSLGGDASDGPSLQIPAFRKRKQRKLNTILALAPLPLGTAAHSTDAYNVVAILTPAKLVVVGLRPSPKTWYRQHWDGGNGQTTPQSRWKGTMAWFPSMLPSGSGDSSMSKQKGKIVSKDVFNPTRPVLVYSWADRLRTLRVAESKVREQAKNPRTGKVADVEVGVLAFEEGPSWKAGGDVLGVQWLNVNQVVVLLADALEVYDVHTRQIIERSDFNASSLVNPQLGHATSSAFQYPGSLLDVSHSMRVYKGKVFILGLEEVQVGTLLTWADRILNFVQEGDFLSAIDLTRSYYVGEALGNKNGLPDDQDSLRQVVGSKMRELMVASTQYTFSEERLTDATHITPDGRGVDRTILFEGLVTECVRACIALDDYDFLFEDLFHEYDTWGISRIFLEQLEHFVMDGRLRHVPPRITQRLIAIYEEDGEAYRAERIIWRIAPECLDINQAINVCQKYQLYDALIYVYTRALQDYVAPVVHLLELLRKVQQYRRSRSTGVETEYNDETVEPLVVNGYKLHSYLAAALSGLTYPSEEALDPDDAFQAKHDVYEFLFFGRSRMWPSGETGRLVLTADEEGGVEPTYPYLRLLLRFDTEAFLHALDIAFEDAYLNDETLAVNRLVMVKILLGILSDPDLANSDITLVNIFIARNVPKYPQFIQMTPSSLDQILVDLAEDVDEGTREDRQLAVEYLLSAYTPHQTDQMLELFEHAGFYRILRVWHRQERQWAPLLVTYLHDPDLRALEMFAGVEETVDRAAKARKGKLTPELLSTVAAGLPDLLRASVTRTAMLLDERAPQLHEQALEPSAQNTDSMRYAYLRFLLGPPPSDEGDNMADVPALPTPSTHVSKASQHLFVALQCRFAPSRVKDVLTYIPSDWLDWDEVMRLCEQNEVYDALIWGLDRIRGPQAAIAKFEDLNTRTCARLIERVGATDGANHHLTDIVTALETVVRATETICRHSSSNTPNNVAEMQWFRLLDGQVKTIQRVSSSTLELPGNDAEGVLSSLRSLFQETFASLMGVTSPQTISLPRLFKRLVDSATDTPVAQGTAYTEFRTILTGMLESYRSDGDMLMIAKRLLDRDVFDSMESLLKGKGRGWAPKQNACVVCHGEVVADTSADVASDEGQQDERIVVARTGVLYHRRCFTIS